MFSSRPTCSARPATTPSAADLERLMPAKCLAHSYEAGGTVRREAIRGTFEREDTIRTIADHVVSEEHLAEEKLQSSA